MTLSGWRLARNRIFILMIVLIGISGCQQPKESGLEAKQFWADTKEAAVAYYKEEESEKANLLELTLRSEESIVLMKREPDTYAIGEFSLRNHQYRFERTSAWVAIENTTGAMWEFQTKAGHAYALKISKAKEDRSAVYRDEMKAYLTVTSGKRTYQETNAINEIVSTSVLAKAIIA